MTSTPPGAPPAVDPIASPRLRRSGSDRMVGGVCGGLAEYSGIDAVLWRVGFVVLTCTAGTGFLAYLLLWVLVPAGPLPPGERPSVLEQWVGRLHDSLGANRDRPRG